MLTVTGGLSNTWNYKNQMTQAVIGSVTTTYVYDHVGQRVKYANGTTTTIYPSKNYNLEGGTQMKHIFAGDMMVATVKGTGASAAVFTAHTDHLSGSNVITNSGGTQEELMDYFPFGEIRIDQKAGTFNEQRKYAGSEFDADTGLNYMNARYYKSDLGRFVSQDPAYLAVGDTKALETITNLKLNQYLADPQNINGYSYVKNNPLVYVDPTGQWLNNAIVSVGNWGNKMYDNHGAARAIMNHPYAFGMGMGLGTGAIIVGGTLLGGGSITCGMICGAAPQTVLIGPALSTQSDKAINALNNASTLLTETQLQIQSQTLNCKIYSANCTRQLINCQVEPLEQ